jgi:hypothetical protein
MNGHILEGIAKLFLSVGFIVVGVLFASVCMAYILPASPVGVGLAFSTGTIVGITACLKLHK